MIENRFDKPKHTDQLRQRNRELVNKERKLTLLEEELNKKKHLFDMQWQLLEHELNVLASEKEQLIREKQLHSQRKKREEANTYSKELKLSGRMFFLGVKDELSLKKRYRDLLKLYHPDNMNGDVNAMQAINKEYHELKRKFEEL